MWQAVAVLAVCAAGLWTETAADARQPCFGQSSAADARSFTVCSNRYFSDWLTAHSTENRNCGGPKVGLLLPEVVATDVVRPGAINYQARDAAVVMVPQTPYVLRDWCSQANASGFIPYVLVPSSGDERLNLGRTWAQYHCSVAVAIESFATLDELTSVLRETWFATVGRELLDGLDLGAMLAPDPFSVLSTAWGNNLLIPPSSAVPLDRLGDPPLLWRPGGRTSIGVALTTRHAVDSLAANSTTMDLVERYTQGLFVDVVAVSESWGDNGTVTPRVYAQLRALLREFYAPDAPEPTDNDYHRRVLPHGYQVVAIVRATTEGQTVFGTDGTQPWGFVRTVAQLLCLGFQGTVAQPHLNGSYPAADQARDMAAVDRELPLACPGGDWFAP